MDVDRVAHFFQEKQIQPFSSIKTTLITGSAQMAIDAGINAKTVFDHVDIYEAPGYVRPKTKSITIPFPGMPFKVLSAKYSRSIKGVVKDLNDVDPNKVRKGNKGCFPNQVALDISLKDKNVNVMIFPHYIKVSGSNCIEHITAAFIVTKAILYGIQLKLENEGRPERVFQNPLILTEICIEMTNVNFKLGYAIKPLVLCELANRHGLYSPPEEGSNVVRILYDMGKKTSKGEDRYYNFRIMNTGSVVFSGNNRTEMEPIYNQFMHFISLVEDQIRFD